jgi:hypothetical protein
MWATSVIFKYTNNHPLGEFSSDLATLFSSNLISAKTRTHLFKIYFVAMPLFLLFNTQTMRIFKSILHKSIAMFSLKI